MKPEIKYLLSPDVDIDKFGWKFDEAFSVFVQALVGPVDEKGHESFGFVFCNSNWISNELKNNDYLVGRNKIMLEEFDKQIILTILQEIMDGINAKNWGEFAQEFAKFGHWEFENYEEFSEES